MSYMPGKRNREFIVKISEDEYEKIFKWTLLKKDIETGGDLFGLWYDSYTPVIQLVLGPGRKVRRSPTSFFQDVEYLENVGSYLTDNEGLCHIGEWHSHHQLGLAKPSGGDMNTVWRNLPRYGLKRFFICISNISRKSSGEYYVDIGCFLFEIDGKTNERLPVLEGKIVVIDGPNAIFANPTTRNETLKGAEERQKRDPLINTDEASCWSCMRSFFSRVFRRRRREDEIV